MSIITKIFSKLGNSQEQSLALVILGVQEQLGNWERKILSLLDQSPSIEITRMASLPQNGLFHLLLMLKISFRGDKACLSTIRKKRLKIEVLWDAKHKRKLGQTHVWMTNVRSLPVLIADRERLAVLTSKWGAHILLTERKLEHQRICRHVSKYCSEFALLISIYGKTNRTWRDIACHLFSSHLRRDGVLKS